MTTAPKRRDERASKPRGRIVRFDHGVPKLTETSGHKWSDEAEEIFLDSLAASANVTLSAAACGFSPEGLYYRRRRHPAFAARWQAALEQGFARLEAELLRTAVDSLSGVEFDADRPLPPMTIAEAVNLYRIHAANVGRAGPRWGSRARRKTMDEVRDGILRKVEAIRRLHGLPDPGPASDAATAADASPAPAAPDADTTR